MQDNDRQAVRDTLQRVYGDATQTPLDDQAAGEVIDCLRARGWVSLDEVAMLVKSAGGRIELDPYYWPTADTVVLVSEGPNKVVTVRP